MGAKTLTLWLACLAAACGSSHDRMGDGSAGDAGPVCTPVAAASQLDLLFVVDNSSDMTEEQVILVERLPRLFVALSAAGLDTQVGVVSTDMGVGGHRIPTCDEPDFGDDGILRTAGNTALSGCRAEYPRFLSFGPADADAAEMAASDVGCVAHMGTGGCGFEQPLEAMLKALTPASSELTFHLGTSGHGDGANAGFLREDSVLAVVTMTREPDCSASDPELFNPAAEDYPVSLGLRCISFPEALHPPQRYVDGLLALRPTGERLVFFAVVGVPPDLISAEYDVILSDSRMQATLNHERRPMYSCMIPDGGGLAFPPRRIVQVAQGLDERSAIATLRSMCTAEYGFDVEALVDSVRAAAAGRTCE